LTGFVDSGEDQVLEHLGFFRMDHFGVDFDGKDLLPAVGHHRDHPSPGRSFHRSLSELFLKLGHLGLELLACLSKLPMFGMPFMILFSFGFQRLPPDLTLKHVEHILNPWAAVVLGGLFRGGLSSPFFEG